MAPEIVVVPGDPSWAARAEEERVRLLAAAGGLLVHLEHIGSTAVPDLAAKPVIDLLGAVASREDTQELARRLEACGYEHRPRAMTDIDVAYFRRMVDGVRSHHLHVVHESTWEGDARRIFRDALRAQPAVATAYAALKRELAVKFADDRMGYTLAKTDFVQGVVARASASKFGAAVADGYERFMVPLLFAPYARDLVARIGSRIPARVLEIAAGTGAVTRELANALPASTAIVATDLNPAMLERAAAIGTSRPVEWRQADALQLPLADAELDLVVCQFGVMFFPDRVRAYAEMRRVLRPGGRLLFSTWDRLAVNEFSLVVHDTVAAMFPDNPPSFFATTPHGYSDPAAIRADVVAAGFGAPRIDVVTEQSRADSAEVAARALCGGTPLRNEITTRDPSRFEEAVAKCTRGLADRFGSGAIAGKMQALVVDVDR